MSELSKYEKEMLDDLVSDLPIFEPVPMFGQEPETVSDLYPELTDQELDYVMSKYKGFMKR